MYRIETTTYGYSITLANRMPARELAEWVQESERILSRQTGEFTVLFDARRLKALGFREREELRKGRVLYREKGMRRSVVITDGPALLRQLRQVAIDSGTVALERYLDALWVHDWSKHALGWLQNGIEPQVRPPAPCPTRAAMPQRKRRLHAVWRALIGS